MNLSRSILCVVALVATSAATVAQETNPTTNHSQQPADTNSSKGPDTTPVYKIQVVAHDIPAINYFHRKGSTNIGFQGTSLLPEAKGTAKVNAVAGRTSIDLQLEGLTHPR